MMVVIQAPNFVKNGPIPAVWRFARLLPGFRGPISGPIQENAPRHAPVPGWGGVYHDGA
jgi:hypothetical protein